LAMHGMWRCEVNELLVYWKGATEGRSVESAEGSPGCP
jgi:hypothetical protein